MTYAEYARWLWDHRGDANSDEWRIVLCFYAAVHATNALLYGGNSGAPKSHTVHQTTLANHQAFAFIVEYEELRELSEQARYEPSLHPIGPVKTAQAERLAQIILNACAIL
jgi:hypothetical protein